MPAVGECQRGEREEDEAQEGKQDAVVGAFEVIAPEQPDHEQGDAWKRQRQAAHQARHAPS